MIGDIEEHQKSKSDDEDKKIDDIGENDAKDGSRDRRVEDDNHDDKNEG